MEHPLCSTQYWGKDTHMLDPVGPHCKGQGTSPHNSVIIVIWESGLKSSEPRRAQSMSAEMVQGR